MIFTTSDDYKLLYFTENTQINLAVYNSERKVCKYILLKHLEHELRGGGLGTY